MSPLLDPLILFAVGVVASVINVLAGGGSLLTLPVMIFLGLPPTVANGTNRVGILVQSGAAVWGFNRHRLLHWGWLAEAAVPSLVGTALGTWVAIRIGDAPFQRILAVLMVGIALWTVWDPLEARLASAAGVQAPPRDLRRRTAFALGFFLVGVYGGFVQAGVGFVILAVTTLAGLDLVRGNAVKVLVSLLFTPLALALFALDGKVDWAMGAALAAGNLVGGLVGVRVAVLKGHEWIKRFVTLTVVVFAVQLWLTA